MSWPSRRYRLITDIGTSPGFVDLTPEFLFAGTKDYPKGLRHLKAGYFNFQKLRKPTRGCN